MDKEKNMSLGETSLTEKDFDNLFKELYPPLCGFANRIVNNLPDAEEIVQDVFVNLWQNQSKIIINKSLKSYLYQMVHNSAINHLEHLRTLKNKVHKLATDDEWKSIHTSYFVEESFLEIMEAMETENKIMALLDQLPDKCKEIFLLSRYHNLSNEEISIKLHISSSTVRVQIFNALNHLRKTISNIYLFFLIFS